MAKTQTTKKKVKPELTENQKRGLKWLKEGKAITHQGAVHNGRWFLKKGVVLYVSTDYDGHIIYVSGDPETFIRNPFDSVCNPTDIDWQLYQL